ncbi:C-C chemokine receptor type 4-like [Scyliorhinus torazame]|uniref:G-protein coupled receptors family 1 profile domain-containing protein n=1 Tax=Scyliorhinus torazame TaxID=75743 RepID=A0A401PS48_SCYTO|nr:hypothetical protein [Scyliorhinus torazame]
MSYSVSYSSVSSELPTMETTPDDEYGDYEYPCNKESYNKFGSTLMPSFYGVVLMLSLIGNGLVLLVLVKYEYLKSITNIFILNLAISDLLSTICLPFWAIHHLNGWIFGVAMCKLINGMFYIGFYSGIMFLTLMTIDRYLAVVHAVSAARSRKIRYATVTSIIVWLTSTLATIPDFYFATLADDNVTCVNIYQNAVSWKLLSYYQQNILFFILPFAIIVYCYFRIIQTLVKCRTVQKHRTLRVIFTIVVVFFLCWSPYNIVIFLRSFEELDLLRFEECELEMRLDYAQIISYTVAYFHCCLNPIFYAFVGQKFRRHLIHFCNHCFPYSIKCYQRQYVTRTIHLEYSDGSMGNDTTNNW